MRRRSGPDSTRALFLARVSMLAPARSSDLAAGVGLDQSTVSRHLQSLESEGLIERRPDPLDRRASHVDLTPEGKLAVNELLAQRAQLIDAALKAWSETDRQTLATLLARLASDLNPST